MANLLLIILWPNFLKGHHFFSLDIWSNTFSDWLEMPWWIAIAIFWIVFSIWYKLIYFSLTLNHAIHRMGNTLNFLIPDVKNKKSFNSVLYFIASFPKLFWDFISELINLKYTFNIPFKVTLKTIIMGTSFQFHDGVQLNILPTLSSEILLLNWAQKKLLWRPGATF